MKWTYTPGPWRINNNIGKRNELGITADKAPCIIACMANWKEWPLKARANAALIAAAPELLTALEMFVAQYAGNGHDEREARPEMQAARAAIRKATGAA